MSINITFKYSHLAEYQRLLFTLSKIGGNFFDKNSFFLTNTPSKYSTSVVIPNCKALCNSDLWRNFKKSDIALKYGVTNPNQFRNIYNFVLKNEVINTNKYLSNWNAINDKFETFLNNLYGSFNINVSVYITYYGTVSSFNITKTGLIIYLRHDSDISQVAFAILNYFFIKNIGNVEDFDNKYFTWEVSQKMHEYLFKYTNLKDVFPNFNEILLKKEKIPLKLLQKSIDIYNTFGLYKKLKIKVGDTNIKINGIIIKTLTKTEYLILKNLILNKDTILTYDTLAEIIWGENSANFFSLEAINKYIERIRAKILISGINKEIILTIRKIGYIYSG